MMFSTPSRKIQVYADQENRISMVLKSAGKDAGSRVCRTPLADVNSKRNHARQQLKDATIKEERLETPKRRTSQSRPRHESPVKQQTRQTPSGASQASSSQATRAPPESDKIPQGVSPRTDVSTYRAEEDLIQATSRTTTPVLVRATQPVLSRLSFDQIAALMSPSVHPIDEGSSSVVPLTLFEPSGCPEDDADISTLVEELVEEVIKTAEKVVLHEAQFKGVCSSVSTDRGESHPTDGVDIPQLGINNHMTGLFLRDDVANISIGNISPLHRTDIIHSSPISDSPVDCSGTVGDSDKEAAKTSQDSGVSMTSHDEMEGTEEISLDSFLSFRDDSSMEGKYENPFLSLTPSKLLENAPKLVPFLRSEISNKSEYEIAQSVRNFWNDQDCAARGNVVITTEKSTHMTPRQSPKCGKLSIGATNQLTSLLLESSVESEIKPTPVSLISKLNEADHLHSTRKQLMSPIRVSVADAETNTTPVCLAPKETKTDHKPLKDTGVGNTVVTMLEMSTYMTPCKSQESSTSPMATANQLTSPIPISNSDAETSTTPINVISKETETDHQPLKDVGVGDTVVTTLEMSTYMTPCKSQESGTSPIATANQLTSLLPISSSNAETSTTPINVSSKVTEMDHQSLKDAGVGDGVATTLEMSTYMTPCKSQECGTSPIATSSQQTSPLPVSKSDAETAVTPVHHVSRETETAPPLVCSVDVETSTSPLMVSPVRLSSYSRTSENSVALMGQMKSSHISNQLLRREVSSLKQSRTKWEEHLQREQQEMKRKMSAITREKTALQDAKVTAKAAAQSQIDELLAQVGQQLGQIAGLEDALQKKAEEISDLEQKNAERKTKYCNEIKELQEDLCMAYKQHEAEVTRLKEDFEKQSSYERLYLQGVKKNRELEEELKGYSSLEEVLDRTAKLQERMPLIQETVTAVKSLFENTQKDRLDLAKQREEMAAREESMRQERELHSAEQSRMNAENTALREALDEETKKTMFVEMERERLQGELVTEQQEKKTMELSFQEALAETTELRAERTQLYEQIEALTRARQEEREDREEQIKRLSAEVDEMRMKNEELIQERDDLRSTIEPLKGKLNAALQRVSDTEEQLKEAIESKDFVDQERESLEEYVKELEGRVATLQTDLAGCQDSLLEGRNTIQQYETTVQNMREHLMGCHSELEHTRQKAHHIIMQQGAQISSASTALAELVSRVDEFCVEMTTGHTMQAACPVDDGYLSLNQSSFVFSILNSPPAGDNGPSSFPTSLEMSAIRASGGSAFSRVTPAKPALPEPERSIAELVQQSNDVFNRLFETVTEKMEKYTEDMRVIQSKSKDLETDVQKSKKHHSNQLEQIQSYKHRRISKDLENDFQKSKKHHSNQLEQIQTELQASEHQVRYLKQELRLALSRSYDQHERNKMSEVDPGMEQLTDRMQREVDRLSVELHHSRQESGAYQEHIATLTALLSANPDPSQKMALLTQLSADNAQLKRKLRNFEGNWQKSA